VAARSSVVAFCHGCFFVVADSHSNSSRLQDELPFAPTIRLLFAIRYSPLAAVFRRGCFFVVADSHSNMVAI
jgi:hypothetical protein